MGAGNVHYVINHFSLCFTHAVSNSVCKFLNRGSKSQHEPVDYKGSVKSQISSICFSYELKGDDDLIPGFSCVVFFFSLFFQLR